MVGDGMGVLVAQYGPERAAALVEAVLRNNVRDVDVAWSVTKKPLDWADRLGMVIAETECIVHIELGNGAPEHLDRRNP